MSVPIGAAGGLQRVIFKHRGVVYQHIQTAAKRLGGLSNQGLGFILDQQIGAQGDDLDPLGGDFGGGFSRRICRA